MPTTCTNIHQLGLSLAHGSTEAEYRASVSRSYYAAYHHAATWEKHLPLPGSDAGHRGGTHQQLVNRLTHPSSQCSQQQKKDSLKLGYMLQDMKTKRHTADYDLNASVDQCTALDVSKASQGVLNF